MDTEFLVHAAVVHIKFQKIKTTARSFGELQPLFEYAGGDIAVKHFFDSSAAGIQQFYFQLISMLKFNGNIHKIRGRIW